MKLLQLTSGRINDFIVLENDVKVSSYIIASIIQYTNEYMAGAIKQFQVKQTDINEFNVTLAIKPAYKGWEQAVADAFIKQVNEPGLNDAVWNFNFVEDIYPDSKTGKLQYFIPLSI